MLWLNCLMVDRSSVNPVGAVGMTDLFQILRDGRPRTRSELAQLSGLARSTVALRIEILTNLGLVGPVKDALSTGGRPSSRVALTADDKFVLAVDIGASHVRIALSNLHGTPLVQDSSDLEIARGPEFVLNWVIQAALALFSSTGRSISGLLAVGVGLPGPVEHKSGRPINPPIMPGWDRFDVPGWLQPHFPVPVLVDNDVNIMALGERAQAWSNTEDLVFVKIATGIGAGIISGGQLQRGAQGIAGDIGHIQVARGSAVLCRCGNYGCLEALASGPALAAYLSAEGTPALNGQDVVDLVKAGNFAAIQAVRQAGRDIGEVLTACVSLINPSVIVIGGSMVQVGDQLIAGLREVVYSRSMPLATQNLQIAQSSAGANAAVLGASMLAIHHALSPERIDAMIGC